MGKQYKAVVPETDFLKARLHTIEAENKDLKRIIVEQKKEEDKLKERIETLERTILNATTNLRWE